MGLPIQDHSFRPIAWCQQETLNLIAPCPTEDIIFELARRILVAVSIITPLIGIIANFLQCNVAPAQPYPLRLRAQAVADLDPYLIPDLANIVAEYAAPWEFGADEWERIFGVHVKPFKLPPEFFTWWGEVDPHDEAGRLNCETYFPPVLIPKTVTTIGAFGTQSVPYSLETLEHLTQNRRDGDRLSRPLENAIEDIELIKQVGVEESYWAVARKEVVDKDQSIAEQMLNQELLPSALDVATVIQTLQAADPRNSYLKDPEIRVINILTNDWVANRQFVHPLLVGTDISLSRNWFFDGPIQLDIFAPQPYTGIALIRQFTAIEY